MHIFIPVTLLASEPELHAATAAMLEKLGLTIKTEDKDFKLIDPSKGKWHVNFRMKEHSDILITENLSMLAKFTVRDIGINTFMSPEFIKLIPDNCTKCYVWKRYHKCMCPPDQGKMKSEHKRYKDQEAAAKRKRRADAATSDASF